MPNLDQFDNKWRPYIFVTYITMNLMFFLMPTALADPPTLEPPATLQMLKGKLGGIPISQVFGTLKNLITKDIGNGFSVQVWRYATRYGECSFYPDDEGEDPNTCPREALVVSMAWDLENSSQFAVWQTQPRITWKLAGDVAVRETNKGSILTIDVLGCEASEDVETSRAKSTPEDTIHLVPYRLEVTENLEKVKFWRQPDTGPRRSCWKTP
ncbi:MAG: hypothetical protein WCC64_04660 [Aliidongia sp.]